MKAGLVNIKNESIKHRFDASYHLSDGVISYSVISKCPYPLKKIKDITNKIFIGGRAKRAYIDNASNGIKFLSSSDILATDLENVKIVSKKYQQGIDEMKLEKDWILISRSGTIGNTAYTNKLFEGKLASEHVMRVVPNDKVKPGLLYAYLSSRFGYSLLTQGMFGGVIQHIEPEYVESLPIPDFPINFQEKINKLIKEASRLRENASMMLYDAEKIMKQKANLEDLKPEDYDFFGHHDVSRKVCAYKKQISEIGSTTFNAFNHSERFRNTLKQLDAIPNIKIKDAISDEGWVSPGGVNVIELKRGNGIMLINQSDIFNNIVEGKWIPKKDKYAKDLLEYGDILIAKIGTLGENETFCRTVFVNEDLDGQLVSSAFYKLRSPKNIPAGYLYCWLNSDWGFRQLRSTQYGTKQCYPNPMLMNEYKMPLLKKEEMEEIDRLVRVAHTKRHKANKLELEAISLVECEIEKWTKE